jgi:hypothetical protein
MISYQEKYLKYKNKYLKLKDLIGGENNYTCNLENRIIDNLCVLDAEGRFTTKNHCELECLEAKLDEEFNAWRQLFIWSSKTFRDVGIYCKGGSALGLQVLKTILDKDRSKYNEFKALKLIKDWDFTVNMTIEQLAIFITKAKELGIENQGETLAILRFNKGLLLGEDYLLELSIKTTQELYDLELPLTNLKFLVNSDNIELFFEIVKMYVKKQEDLDIMSRNLDILLTTIQVNGIEQVDSIQNGLYTITDPVKLSTAGLHPQLLEIMDQIPFQSRDLINPLTMIQFLITQICQPDRLFMRYLGKNVIKSRNITNFYTTNGIPLPEWLINESVLKEIEDKITLFLTNLNKYIISLIPIKGSLDKPTDLLKPFMVSMNNLFQNVNLSRIELTPINTKLLRYLVPMEFFQIIKEKAIENQKAKNEKFIASPQGQALTKEQIDEKRGKIFIVQAKFIPKGDSKYTQFLSTFIDQLN